MVIIDAATQLVHCTMPAADEQHKEENRKKKIYTVKIFILGCNYSETEVYWTGTKLEHLGFLGVSQFCSGPEQFCWGRIFIPIPTPPRCIVHLWAKKNRRTPRFF